MLAEIVLALADEVTTGQTPARYLHVPGGQDDNHDRPYQHRSWDPLSRFRAGVSCMSAQGDPHFGSSETRFADNSKVEKRTTRDFSLMTD